MYHMCRLGAIVGYIYIILIDQLASGYICFILCKENKKNDRVCVCFASVPFGTGNLWTER